MKKFTLFLSYAFSAIGFVLIAALMVAAPLYRLSFITMFPIAENYFWLVLLCSYVILGLMALANVCLVLLLKNVRMDSIFTAKSVQLLRIISWASILAGVASIPLFFFIKVAIAVTYIALFLGLVLRVIKQVIEKGTMLKDECDSTI